MNKFIDRFVNKRTGKKLRRYKLLKTTANEFPDEQTLNAYILTQLEIRGFDIHKPYQKYTTESGTIILFEQEL